MMTYRLIDTHAHLDEIENIDNVLAEARAAGLEAIIAVGIDMESNRRVLDLSEKHRGFVYAALGWHPENVRESEINTNLEFIEDNIDRAVGIGEVGLDYHKRIRAVAGKDLQKRALGELLKIARAHDKPALVHSRYAWRDAFDIVDEAGIDRAVFHWYTGTSSVLRDIIARGYYISVTPAVAYHEEHRRAVKESPLDRLLLETDSPVVYARGREMEFRASPADVVRSLRGAAELRGLSEEEMAAVTTGNAGRLFGIGGKDD
jgi:TatD DNase family protein